jgi:hypothetical protein
VHACRVVFIGLLAGGALALTGCAGTRVAEFGPLADNTPLVRLIVSEDRGLIERECEGAMALSPGPILGCQKSQPILLDGNFLVRTVKIVRFTDVLPSAMAFEIDAHELCHAIASVQEIRDPCHTGNGGMLRSSLPYSGRHPWR